MGGLLALVGIGLIVVLVFRPVVGAPSASKGPEYSTKPADVLRAAAQRLEGAKAVREDFLPGTENAKEKGTLEWVMPGLAIGSVTKNGGTADILQYGTGAFYKGDEEYWRQSLDEDDIPAWAELKAGRWLSASSDMTALPGFSPADIALILRSAADRQDTAFEERWLDGAPAIFLKATSREDGEEIGDQYWVYRDQTGPIVRVDSNRLGGGEYRRTYQHIYRALPQDALSTVHNRAKGVVEELREAIDTDSTQFAAGSFSWGRCDASSCHMKVSLPSYPDREGRHVIAGVLAVAGRSEIVDECEAIKTVTLGKHAAKFTIGCTVRSAAWRSRWASGNRYYGLWQAGARPFTDAQLDVLGRQLAERFKGR
ncbi:hypothetical protein [Nonomuraea sp. LPB2021202275-12-8]|uniref:hypothetical protein n=1 Tax=Nonomuraea sp. LPB2021202275-12-8 TaxID=3120159 RepID=UPI00300C0797